MFEDTESSSRWSEMISALFSIPKIQDGRHIDMLSMLSDLLIKKTKIWGNYLVVEPKMYFLSEPMESNTYLDHQNFIIVNLST